MDDTSKQANEIDLIITDFGKSIDKVYHTLLISKLSQLCMNTKIVSDGFNKMSAEDQHVTVTVRLIRSFEHRTIKHIVVKDVSLSQTTQQFLTMILQDIKTRPGLPPPFKKHSYDILKISHQPFGAKTSDPVINKENDELILQSDKTLQESGIVNETEISLFNLKEYRAYQQNPTLVW